METPCTAGETKRTFTWKTVVGIVVGSLGALGIFVLFVVSRFMDVMVPMVEEQNGSILTTYDSSVTTIDFGLFLEQYKLHELLYMLIAMVFVGLVFMCWDKYAFPFIKKMSRLFW